MEMDDEEPERGLSPEEKADICRLHPQQKQHPEGFRPEGFRPEGFRPEGTTRSSRQ
jgi:hypothetical protein